MVFLFVYSIHNFIADQGGTKWVNASNAITNANMGKINSNFAGAQAVFNHRWFNVTFGYENVWGPADAFGHGAIVSPYNYNENVDPMYANSWMTSLVQKASSGQMYNITTTFSFIENTLSISPAYSQILNTVGQQANSLLGTSNPDQEFDLVFNYKVKQIPGLKFFGVYSADDDVNLFARLRFTTDQGQRMECFYKNSKLYKCKASKSVNSAVSKNIA